MIYIFVKLRFFFGWANFGEIAFLTFKRRMLVLEYLLRVNLVPFFWMGECW